MMENSDDILFHIKGDFLKGISILREKASSCSQGHHFEKVQRFWGFLKGSFYEDESLLCLLSLGKNVKLALK